MSSSCFTDLAQQYIDGEWRPGTGSWDIIDFNPYDDEKLASITIATADEVDQAYRAAARAQKQWAATNPYARRTVFEKALRLIEEREAEISEAIIAELGGTRLKAAFELHLAKEFLREAVHLALAPEGRIIPSPVDGKENRVYRVPVGVVGVISPFNFPFLLSIKSVAPALALGNAVVLKPHQNTPIVGGSLVAKIFEDAGLPGGLLNVVITDIAEIGDAFIEHPVPKVISFTGSDAVGRHVATVCARLFKRSILELGGNSALVVLDDADIEYAVDAAVFSRYVHQGQVCMAANRVLVDRSVADEFTEKFVAKVRTLKAGDPRDPETVIGPVINSSQADAVSGVVEQALAEGATALVRGGRTDNLVEPSVLTGVPMRLGPAEAGGLRPGRVPRPVRRRGGGRTPRQRHAVRPERCRPHREHRAGRRVRQADRHGHVPRERRHRPRRADRPLRRREALGDRLTNGDTMLDSFTTTKWISVQHGRSGFPF